VTGIIVYDAASKTSKTNSLLSVNLNILGQQYNINNVGFISNPIEFINTIYGNLLGPSMGNGTNEFTIQWDRYTPRPLFFAYTVSGINGIWTSFSFSQFSVSGEPEPEPDAIIDAGPANLWIGLKNSDDQGTQFDIKTELHKNDILISEGKTLCITGVTRNPSLAKEASVVFGPVSNGEFVPGDTLSLKVFTRIGTTPDGLKCSGPGGSHNNAVGLRLYYDAPTRPSGFSAEISPDLLHNDLFLHSSGATDFFDDVSPIGTVKYKDSGSVNFNNGNPWKEIGTWSMPLQ